MPRQSIIAAILLPTMLLTASGRADVTVSSDANSLKTWTLSEDALKLQLVQRLPEQTKAFFLARGFPPAVADDIANSCVFQLIGMNAASADDPTEVRIDLKAWRILQDGKAAPLKLKEVWAREWSDDVPVGARVAFRWATFPTDQVYHPADDHNWGMVSLGPKPGTTVDLDVVWFEDGEQKSRTINAITCPTDPESGNSQ